MSDIYKIMKEETIKDFECIFTYRTSKKIHTCIFKGYDEKQVKKNFSFFYPRRILKEVNLKKLKKI